MVKTLLAINSKFRKNYEATQSTDFIYNLPCEFKNIKSMRYCFSWFSTKPFAITPDNGSNHLKVNNTDVYVKGGDYSGQELATELTSQITAAGVSNVTVTYSRNLNKFVFTEVTTTNLALDFTYQDKSNCFSNEKLVDSKFLSLGWLLGFRKLTYTHAEDYILAEDAERRHQVGINAEAEYTRYGNRYFLLYVNDFLNNHKGGVGTSYKNSTLGEGNILAQIKFHYDPGDKFVSTETVSDVAREYAGKSDINRLHIKLLDEFGRVISLNNTDFTVSIELETD